MFPTNCLKKCKLIKFSAIPCKNLNAYKTKITKSDKEKKKMWFHSFQFPNTDCEVDYLKAVKVMIFLLENLRALLQKKINKPKTKFFLQFV